MDDIVKIKGKCACGEIEFHLTRKPIIVHCCHCRWCQRETGSAFVINAMIEASKFVVGFGNPEVINTPTLSGKGQKVSRCPTCKIALWSNYAGAGEKINFVRVGTFLDPDAYPPDIHIFTASKQPWVTLPKEIPAFEEYYEREEVWSTDSIQRRQRAILS